MSKGAPKVSAKTLEILSDGGGILLPFDADDAPISFASRWALAEKIERLCSIISSHDDLEDRRAERREISGIRGFPQR